MRGAAAVLLILRRYKMISTHAPHARRGLLLALLLSVLLAFLLTRLMRGAAENNVIEYRTLLHFYSRASCEARLL
mgnify:CR=1 FL=1